MARPMLPPGPMTALAVWTLVLHVVWTPVPWTPRETSAVVMSVGFHEREDCRAALADFEQFAPLAMALGGLENGTATIAGGCFEDARAPDEPGEGDPPPLADLRAAEGARGAAARAWAGRIRSLDVRAAPRPTITASHPVEIPGAEP